MIELTTKEEIALLHAVNKFYREQNYDGKFYYHEKDITFTLNYGRYGNAILFEDYDINGDEFIIVKPCDYENFSDEILDAFIEDVAQEEFSNWLNRVEDCPYRQYMTFNERQYKTDLEQDDLGPFAGYDGRSDIWMTILEQNPEKETNPHAPMIRSYESYTFFYN